MKEEINRILKMVEEGKITSDQASELISAIKETGETAGEQTKSCGCKNLKVLIKSHEGSNVNLKLPLKFVKGIIKATGKLPVNINSGQEINMKVITDAIENDICGKIVEICSDDGDNVEVIIE